MAFHSSSDGNHNSIDGRSLQSPPVVHQTMSDGNSENNSIKIGKNGTHLLGGSQIQTDGVEKDGRQRNKENEIRVLRQHNQFLKYAGKIGEGSFKRVYKGWDTSNELYVAWCEILYHKLSYEDRKRFQDEVEILKAVKHPNILCFHDSFEFIDPSDQEKVLVLITEHMADGSLNDYMKRFPSIELWQISNWGRQILMGLKCLHTQNPRIIHRDLKCDNIFVSHSGKVVKIGDLGLATLKKTYVKTAVGTPEFMAPETYDEHYDHRVDVYAFGMCLLEMCTQECPYKECDGIAPRIWKKVSKGKYPDSLATVSSDELKVVIEGCIKHEKSERFTVDQLLKHKFFAETYAQDLIPENSGIKNNFTIEDVRTPTGSERSSSESSHASVSKASSSKSQANSRED